VKYTQKLLQEAKLTTVKDLSEISTMKSNKLIEVKQLKNNVISLNFGDEAFQQGIWNDQTTKARGLFFSNSLQKIIARGYDKFFNLGEMVGDDKLSLENIISDKIQFPVNVWHKYNGYLGILSVHETTLDNIVYSGAFFNAQDFKLFTTAYPDLKINIAFPHITWGYHNNNAEKANALNDAFIQNKNNKKKIWDYTFSKLYVSEDGNLVAAKVDDGVYLSGYTPDVPHVTLYASGQYKPVDSAKLISGQIKGNVFSVKQFTLNGRPAHFNTQKKLQPIYDRFRLFVASKSTDKHKFANNFRMLLSKQLYKIPGALADLKRYLKKYDVSMVFEVIDIENDPHIIDYAQSSIVLLDVIYNTVGKFKSVKYPILTARAKKLGIEYKKRVEELKTIEALQKFVQKVTGVDYELETIDEQGQKKSEPVEGFVFEGKNGYMFKIKTNYYNFWKKIRGVAESVQKNKNKQGWVTPLKGSKEYEQLLKRFYGEEKLLEFVLNTNLSDKKIIDIRDEYLKQDPNFKIKTIVFDSEEATGKGKIDLNRKYEKSDEKITFNETDPEFKQIMNDWQNTTKLNSKNNLNILQKHPNLNNFNLILDRAKNGKYSVDEAVSDIKNKIQENNKIALVLIGIPGSGKSYFINQLKNEIGANKVSVHSTDDKFMINKEYVFDENKLGTYHDETQKEAEVQMQNNKSLVILDNTNLKFSDFSYDGPNKDKYKFTNFAKENGYKLHFVMLLTNPKTIIGNEGIQSEDRLNMGKTFNTSKGKKTLYSMLSKFLSNGIPGLLGTISKFK
jgi:predicted kinase